MQLFQVEAFWVVLEDVADFSFTLKMEAEMSSETLVSYHNKSQKIPTSISPSWKTLISHSVTCFQSTRRELYGEKVSSFN